MNEKAKILVIRGGAIGDFVLTLPAIGLLRDAFPDAHLELLGYKHIVALAEGRHYADAARSIEYAGLASFFVPNADLPPDLVEYFAQFQQVVSYLFDPDGFFEANVRRAGVRSFLAAFAKVEEAGKPVHAARQLARPLEQLALFLGEERAAIEPRLRFTPDDGAFAADFLKEVNGPVLAVHPGSGGRHKVWPVECWRRLLEALRRGPKPWRILLAGGEADAEAVEALRCPGDLVAWNLPLPRLGAIFERSDAFVGHDSGISHLAAAAGVPCVLLFGPTNPEIWAPSGAHVRVVTKRHAEGVNGYAAEEAMAQISPESVMEALRELLGGNRGAEGGR